MRALSARLISSGSSHSLIFIVQVVEQIALLPLMLVAWGANQFGEWAALTAIPVYFAMSDLGIGTAVANEMVNRAARGELLGARRLYKVYQSRLAWFGGSALLLLTALLIALPYEHLLRFGTISKGQSDLILFLLMANIVLKLLRDHSVGGFRYLGLYAVAMRKILIFAAIRVLVCASLLFFAHPSPVIYAAALCGLSLIDSAFLFVGAERVAPPRTCLSDAPPTSEPLAAYLRHGVGYVAFSIGAAVSLQGAVLVVSSALGPLATAVFASHRTLARTVAQALQPLIAPIQSEIGLLQSSKARQELVHILSVAVGIAFWFSLGGVIVAALAGKIVFTTWTGGHLPFHPHLFLMLLGATAVETWWRLIASVGMGTNRHQPIARAYLAISAASTGVMFVLASNYGLDVGSVATLVAAVFMLVLTIRATLPLIGIRAIEILGWLHPQLIGVLAKRMLTIIKRRASVRA